MSDSLRSLAGMPAGVRPRKASAAELPQLSLTLAAAFFDDPVFAWCYDDPVRRREILPAFFGVATEAIAAADQIYTTETGVAGAVWVPPGVDDDEQLAMALGDVSGEYADRLFRALEMMADGHPQEPHHYLFLLGTRPECQSRGIGSELIRPVLEICDRDQMPAYLEATSEGNRRLYLRHGFEVTEELGLPDGPPMWRMWRAPEGG